MQHGEHFFVNKLKGLMFDVIAKNCVKSFEISARHEIIPHDAWEFSNKSKSFANALRQSNNLSKMALGNIKHDCVGKLEHDWNHLFAMIN